MTRRRALTVAAAGVGAAALGFVDAAPAAAANGTAIVGGADNNGTQATGISTTSGAALYSYASANDAAYAVFGGLSGAQPNGSAVWGQVSSTSDTTYYSNAVLGQNKGSGAGVRGRSHNGDGVVGESDLGYGVVGLGLPVGVAGEGGPAGCGVRGSSKTGQGVVGRTTMGQDLVADGTGVLLLLPLRVGPPTTGRHVVGEIVRDQNGDLWCCIVGSGSSDSDPGAWSRAALVAPGYAGGATHTLASPVRVLDTRAGQPAFSHPGAPYAAGSAHDVQLSGLTYVGVRVPGRVAAVIGNVTVVAATAGYLTVYPAGSARPTASTLNFVAGQVVANSLFTGVSAENLVTVYVSGKADVIVDVIGFVL